MVLSRSPLPRQSQLIVRDVERMVTQVCGDNGGQSGGGRALGDNQGVAEPHGTLRMYQTPRI